MENATATRTRRTPAQMKAYRAYVVAEAAEERYLGSIFVTPEGRLEYADKTKAALELLRVA